MNTSFVITKDAEIEYNRNLSDIRQTVQDCLDELTGGRFDRQTTSNYLDHDWLPNMQAWSESEGEVVDVQLPDELWQEYKNDILSEVERQSSSPF